MAMRRISKLLADLKRQVSSKKEKERRNTQRRMEMQQLEDRNLMALYPVSIDPQPGDVLSETTTTTLNTAPTEIKFDFEAFGSIKLLPTSTTPQAQTAELSKSIIVTRPGTDGAFGTTDDVQVKPGFLGLGDRPWEVIMRFNEPLPDDLYQITIVGTTTDPNRAPLTNTQSFTFPKTATGKDVTYQMNLELGSKVVAVVPQPVTRKGATDDWLTQAEDKVVVYFERGNEPLDAASAQNKSFYQFFATRNSLDPTDQIPIPASSIQGVVYDPVLNASTITFTSSLSSILSNQSIFPADGSADPIKAIRLRIGTNEAPRANVSVVPLQDPDTLLLGTGQSASTIGPGWSFDTAYSVGALSSGSGSGLSKVFSESISPQYYSLPWPGGEDEPGHRNTPAESHLLGPADTTGGVVTQYYNFRDEIGQVVDTVTGNIQRSFNVITPEQKQLAREIFDLYSKYSGVQFIERVNPKPLDSMSPFDPELQDIIVGTGDLRVMGGSSGPGGVIGLAGSPVVNANGGTLFLRMSLMDSAEAWSNVSGDAPAENGGSQQSWYVTAMHEIGHQLGLGHTYDLPGRTVMGEDPSLASSIPESAFPGAADIMHMQYLYRPDSKDIDMYKIDVTQNGTLSVETMAERLHNASTLDTYLTLWRETTIADIDPETGLQVTLSGVPQFKKVRELVAANDDYFSKDSQLQIKIDSTAEYGTYYVGVSAKGNDRYDPNIADSGMGGTTEGKYELRLDFQQDVSAGGAIKDSAGTLIDGDGDGRPGGVSNFWFRVAKPMGTNDTRADGLARTLYVEKTAQSTQTPNGSLARPFRDIDDALAVARPYDIVRIIGNGGADNDVSTTSDNVAYKIGFNAINSQPLEDGSALNVPKNVTVMIDAGAIFQMRQGWINVGSTAATTNADRSGGALQVLGTPQQRVYFTSYNEEKTLGATIGRDDNTSTTSPQAGDWGGISFQQDVDKSDGRFTFDSRGIFIDYVNYADIRYGGGKVLVDTSEQVVTPVRMVNARPTVTNNLITSSADAAVSANPDSFEETNFRAPRFNKSETSRLNPDYSRVGPEVRGNTFIRTNTVGNVTTTYTNSINGMFIRSTTPSGGSLEKLTVTGRLDDIDIVHVVAENIVIAGTSGGVQLESVAPSMVTVTARILSNGSGSAPGRFNGTSQYGYKVVFVDIFGNESPASTAISNTSFGGSLKPNANGQFVRLSNLPATPAGYVGRRIYRSDLTLNTPYRLVGALPSTITTFDDYNIVDLGQQQELLDNNSATLNRPRPDGTLVVDPRVIMKLEGSRIELEQGSTMIAEGNEGVQVVFTSLSDDRWGAGGTFDTRGDDRNPVPAQATAGDWAGIEARQDSLLSIDQAVISYGGGKSRIEGSLTGMNPVEIIEADARITNVLFEHNDNGVNGQAPPQRFGRGGNAPGVVFVRSAQPVIANNTFINNLGASSPVITINANAMTADQVVDLGRQRALSRDAVNPSNGLTIDNDRIPNHFDNQGPLVVGNVLENNTYNGMQVRGATLTTESVWDDTDIVHILLNQEIVVPDFHTYGGLRLESHVDQSLVVKSLGANAGFRATGRPLEINDRIGGRIQVIGQPGFPVIMTSLNDDTASAGSRTDGRPQGDTNNNNPPLVLTPGAEIATNLLIDNDIPSGTNGFLAYNATTGGNAAPGSQMKVPASGALLNMINASLNYVRVGTGATAKTIALSATTITQVATRPGAEDIVVSKGTFKGDANQDIVWTATSEIKAGKLSVINTFDFVSSTGNLGALQLISSLDANVSVAGATDIIYALGGDPVQGQSTFRLATLANAGRYGIAQGGVYNTSSALVNATWNGFAAKAPAALTASITSLAGQAFTRDFSQITGVASIVDPSLGKIWGPADVGTAMGWTVNSATNSAKITTFLDLIPTNPVNAGQAGEWKGITLEKNSNDRNVAVVVESESDLPGDAFERDGSPSRSQFLGSLAQNAKSGDETLRLGFTVNGTLRSSDDVDVYTFYADAGTEIWIDVDRTTHALDTVVELVDENGKKIFLSDNSGAESSGGEARFEDTDYVGRSSKLDKPGAATSVDYYTTNPRDAGMRVRLYGPPGQHLYHMRVRSSNPNDGATQGNATLNGNVDGIRRGVTKGAYQVEVRLQQTDEFAGSSIQFADLRNATTGIQAIGLPYHSPLISEAGEPANENNTNDLRANATDLGNIFTSDKGTISFAGVLGGLLTTQNRVDVDWYKFTAVNAATQLPVSEVVPFEIDVDYADGLGRPDVDVYLYNSNGLLLASSRDSNVADDRPRPNSTSNVAELSRGSVSTSDAFLGPIGLPTGPGITYYLAIASKYATSNGLANNTTMRSEPINSTVRIVEDHIEDYVTSPISTGASTYAQPKIENLLNNDGSSAVPFKLGDVKLFVAQEKTPTREGANLFMVNPFTGVSETYVGGNIGFDVGDIAFRSNGQLYTYELDEDAIATDPRDDTEAGRYYSINTGTSATTALGADGITTYELDQTVTPPVPAVGNLVNGARIGWGMNYYAMTFGDVNNNTAGERLLMVGNRGDSPQIDTAGTGSGGPVIDRTSYIPSRSNILYQALPASGAFLGGTVGINSRILPNEPGPNNFTQGPYTQEYEVGEIPTQPIMATVDVTQGTVNNLGQTVTAGLNSFILKDGQQFIVDDGTGPVTYEFDSGPEILNDASFTANQPSSFGNTITDGDFFLIDPDTTVANDETLVQFDTGASINFNLGASGTGAGTTAALYDGQQITVNSPTGSRTFIFDTNSNQPFPGTTIVLSPGTPNPPGANLPSVNPTLSPGAIATALANAVSASGIGVTATVVGTKVSFTGETGVTVSNTLIDPAAIAGAPIVSVLGSNGMAPVLKFPAANAIAPGTQLAFQTTLNVPTLSQFYFRVDGVGAGLGTPIDIVTIPAIDTGAMVAAKVANAIALSPDGVLLQTKQVNDKLMVNGSKIVNLSSPSIPDLAVTLIPDRQLVNIEESWPLFTPRTQATPSPLSVAYALEQAINLNTSYVVGVDLNRINFPNFTEGSFATLASPQGYANKLAAQSVSEFSIAGWSQPNGVGTAGLIDTAARRIPFLAQDGNLALPGLSDSPVPLGDRVVVAVNDNPGPVASSTIDRVSFDKGTISVPGVAANPTCAINPPTNRIYVCGEGPGGLISGMANLNGDVYAVSTNGGLFKVNPNLAAQQTPAGTPNGSNNYTRFVDTQYIGNSKTDLTGIKFEGLTVGPQATENGRYKNTLFAIDDAGRLYAIAALDDPTTTANEQGRLQPIFNDGAVYVDTGLTGARGLGFSDLEDNLWHITPPGPPPALDRQGDATHGIPSAFDGSRPAAAGSSSYYFGTDGRNYDFNGGAYGTIISNEFSLKGYSSEDQPILNFNYFNASETAAGANLGDQLRVSVSDDSGDWTSLMVNGTQNNSSGLAPNASNWVQARVSLAGFAGREHLRLRFEFVTGGNISLGSPSTHGDEIYALPGYQIADGNTFELADGIGSFASTIFEFESGFSLNTGTGASIPAGQTLDVDGNTFTVIKSGVPAPNEILILDAMTPREVAKAIGDAIDAAGIGVTSRYNNDVLTQPDQIFNPTPVEDDNVVNFEGATSVTVNGAPIAGLTVSGNIGTTNPANIPVLIHRGMTRKEVADAMRTAIERRYLQPTLVATDGSQFADGQVFTLDDGLGVTQTFEIDTGHILKIPVNGAKQPSPPNTFVQVGDSFTLSDGTNTLQFVMVDSATTSTGYAGGNVYNIAINSSMTQSAIARLISVSILNDVTPGFVTLKNALGLDGTAVSNGRVQLGGNTGVTFTVSTTAFGGALPADPKPGVAVGNQAIFIKQASTFTPANVAQAVSAAINASSIGPPTLTATVDPTLKHRIQLILSDPANQLVTLSANTTPLQFQTATGIVNQHDSTIYAIGHDLILPAALPGVRPTVPGIGYEDALASDPAGTVLPATTTNVGITNLRGQNNAFEGAYIDDIVIGFRERGEMMTYTGAAAAVDTFTVPVPNTGIAFTNLEGPYQVEIRRGAVYGTPTPVMSGTTAETTRTFDTNDRVNQSIQLIARSGANITDGQTFTLGDGINFLTFEFDDLTTPAYASGFRVAQGNIAIPFLPSDTSDVVSNKIRDVINSTDVKSALNIDAATSDGIIQTGVSTDKRINVHGNGTLLVEGHTANEPNDVRGTEVAVDLNASDRPVYLIDGTIGDRTDLNNSNSDAKDVDLFEVQLDAGAVIHVDIDADILGSNLNSYLRIFRKDISGVYTELTNSDDDIAPGESTTNSSDSYLAFTAPATGTYVIGVSSFGNGNYNPTAGVIDASYVTGGTTGKYQLEISGSLDPSVFRPLLPSSIDFKIFNDKYGDDNLPREQGQLIIANNVISRMSNWGIVVDAAARVVTDGNAAHPGSVRQLSQINNDRLAPGVVIMNNVIYNNDVGGILFSGDNSVVGPQGAVPFGRIANNTLFGKGGTIFDAGFNDDGIRVEQNASPTLLNNIIANFDQGIVVDASSQTLGTVAASSVYQGNVQNSTISGDLDFTLALTDPLFINPISGNFYLKEFSPAIDSAVKSLLDRADMTRIRDPLGISTSPIVVPENDIQGLKRVDDSRVSTPSGVGDNKFVDRGAVERADFDGPSGGIVVPLDNGISDQDTNVNRIGLPASFSLREMVIQLVDINSTTGTNNGSGVDDSTVTSDLVIVRDVSTNRLLVDGVDYTFFYDTTTNKIHLAPIGVQFPQPATYEIELDINNGNSLDPSPAIRDLAGNLLTSNGVETGPSGPLNVHKYTVAIGTALDYGDAPTPYPVTRAQDGARHELLGNFKLGNSITLESDGTQTSGNASDDSGDDGITNFNLIVNGLSSFDAIATEDGILDAWIDLNNNGVWEDSEHVVVGKSLVGGTLTTVTIPATSMNAVGGDTYARFRLTKTGLGDDGLPLKVTGSASSGEVEDYKVNIAPPPFRNPDTFLWRGTRYGFDVDNNKKIEPLDILWLVYAFNKFDTDGDLKVGLAPPPVGMTIPSGQIPGLSTDRYYDVNGDNVIDINDIFKLVGFFNSPEYLTYVASNPEGEGASVAVVNPTAAAVSNPVPATVYAASNVTVEVVTGNQAQAAVDDAVFGAPGVPSAAEQAAMAQSLTHEEPESNTSTTANDAAVFALTDAAPGVPEDDDLLDILACDVGETFENAKK